MEVRGGRGRDRRRREANVLVVLATLASLCGCVHSATVVAGAGRRAGVSIECGAKELEG